MIPELSEIRTDGLVFGKLPIAFRTTVNTDRITFFYLSAYVAYYCIVAIRACAVISISAIDLFDLSLCKSFLFIRALFKQSHITILFSILLQNEESDKLTDKKCAHPDSTKDNTQIRNGFIIA